MTDNNTLEDNNIKGFDEPSRYVSGNHKVGSYPTGFESKTSCSDSFRGNFEDAITIIDVVPELFPEIFKEKRSSSISTNKLQEFVN
jgi:hypothetical protein